MSIGTVGPSNPESVGFQSAIDAIAAAIARALHRPHPRVISAVLAIAGINNLSEQQRILSSLPMVPAADLAAQGPNGPTGQSFTWKPVRQDGFVQP